MTAIVRSLIALLLAAASSGCERRAATLGFWFEEVAFDSPVLGGQLTAQDMQVIESTAREELAIAFREIDVTLTSNPDARYRVRVLQELFGNPLVRKFAVAGESRSLPLIGASGAVHFSYFASGAIVFAPEGLSRQELLVAIGRGIGRGAVHEFAHQLIRGGGDLHATRDRGSYEYHAASRAEQYYGPMHWDTAAAALKKQFASPLDLADRR